MRRWVMSLVALAATAPSVSGQPYGDETAAFAGLSTVRAQVLVSWDERITGKTRDQFTQELESSFLLGVQRTGVKVEGSARTFLVCRVEFLYTAGLVASSTEVSFQEIIGRRFAETWSSSVVGTVGDRQLEGKIFGAQCAEAFEAAYRSANPGQREPRTTLEGA